MERRWAGWCGVVRRSGLQRRPIKSSADRLDALPLPADDALGRQPLGGRCMRVEGDRLRIADPARGLRSVDAGAELTRRAGPGYAALAWRRHRASGGRSARGGLDLRWIVAVHRAASDGVLVIALDAGADGGGPLKWRLLVLSGLVVNHVIGASPREIAVRAQGGHGRRDLDRRGCDGRAARRACACGVAAGQ